MLRISRRLTIAAVAAFAIAPAAASAVTATVDKACYSRVPLQGSEPINVTLSGGTPGANFLLTASSSGSASGTFDDAGNAVAQLTNVTVPSGGTGPLRGKTVTLAVTDYGLGADATAVPVATVKMTNLSMDVANKPRNPRLKRRVSVSGTPFARKRLYGFITTTSGSKILRRFPLGKANDCGFTSDTDIVAPVNYKTGDYRLWINAGKQLRKQQAISYRFRIYTTTF